MGNGAASHAELYSAYRAEINRERLIRSTRSAALVVMILSTAFIALDAVAYPEFFRKFLGVRLGLDAVLALIYFRTARTHPVPSSLLGCLAIGFSLLAVIEGAGGLLGEYYVGLVLLFVGMPVFMPYTTKQATVLVGILLGSLAGLPFLGPAVDWRMYLLHLFFPAAAAIECVASCAVLDGFRFRDFLRRRELEEARDHLKALDREKSRFTANVHHELRTPLTLMLAPTEAMLGGEFGAVSSVQHEYLRTIHSNGLRLLKLINNLLDLAKIEGKQLTIRRESSQVETIVTELVAGARPLAERKGIRLSARTLGQLPVINLDRDALEKIVVNLIGNALKFTDSGGTIEITADQTSEGGVHLVVSDTGVGLPPDQLERIFDRFAQVDGSSTRHHEGTGIGLALARELVELHGGEIWAESEGVGHGTRMHVVVPCGEPDDDLSEEVLHSDEGDPVVLGNSIAAMEGELEVGRANEEALRFTDLQRSVERNEFAAAEPDQGHGAAVLPPDAPEVLICEDNADMRRLLGFLVGQEFRVRMAVDGREGFERIRECQPDLVLTDVMMPEMSGTELCRSIKSDPETESIPVVLVTSKAEREMKIEGLELGADDYVMKPFHSRELMARIRSLVKLRRLQEELAKRNALLERANEELRVTLAELREASVRLAQAEQLAAVGELAAGVAHEINNPMNFVANALKTLQGYVEDMHAVTSRISEIDWSDRDGLDAQVKELEKLKQQLDFDGAVDSLGELVEIVSEGLERTQRLVGDLRDFAMPSGDEHTNVDLARGINTTVQLMSHMLREAGIELRLDLAEALPPVKGDPRALNQVFLNLLKNAAEALDGREGTIWVTARPEGDSIVLNVRDDGPGIVDELHARIFEPFYSTKEAGTGTGLGLSISRRIIGEHEGTIEVSSRPGEGTVFTVTIPIGGG